MPACLDNAVLRRNCDLKHFGFGTGGIFAFSLLEFIHYYVCVIRVSARGTASAEVSGQPCGIISRTHLFWGVSQGFSVMQLFLNLGSNM